MDSRADSWASSPLLQGRLARLEPLDERHVPELLIAATDPVTWTWMPMRLDDDAAMRTWLADALRARDAGTELPFATLEATTGRAVGSTRYMAIAPAPDRLGEAASTWRRSCSC
jgi:hypothetical protein